MGSLYLLIAPIDVVERAGLGALVVPAREASLGREGLTGPAGRRQRHRVRGVRGDVGVARSPRGPRGDTPVALSVPVLLRLWTLDHEPVRGLLRHRLGLALELRLSYPTT